METKRNRPARLITRLSRLKKIESLLLSAGAEGVKAAALARQLGTNRRTIYRDLLDLPEFGVPVFQDRGHWGIDATDYRTPFPGPTRKN